jgi:hypothetical protein
MSNGLISYLQAFAMVKSPEEAEGEIEKELEAEAQIKRRKTWQDTVERHDGHAKLEGGCVKIFLQGTSEELVIYTSPPKPLLRHVLDELLILHHCPGGVLFESGTRRSLLFYTVLPVGEYDFVPAPNSGYIDGN